MRTDTRIDWLSFTVPCQPMHARSFDEMHERVGQAQKEFAPNFDWDYLIAPDWETAKGRAPYRECLRSSILGLSVFWGEGLEHILHEFSGTGCARLTEQFVLYDLLAAIGTRVTRLDIATDFETDTTPRDFVEQGWSDRISSRGSFTSASGDTEYIGSAKSERYARVYRYAPPHPRAGLLRVEHVLRRDYARSLIPFILKQGHTEVQRSVGEQMGWKHPLWQACGVQGVEWRPPRNDRKTSGTERWLITQAASAFKKLVVSGVIEDPHAWLVEHFLKATIDIRQIPLELPEASDSEERG